jgi:cell division protein FtsI/penicillin-binding protein 2
MTDLIVSPLDQEVPSNVWILDDFDSKVAKAVEQKDVTILYDAILDLREKAKAVGLTLAKMLYTASTYWHVFEIDEEFSRSFYEPVGLDKHTVERYVRVWSMFDTKQIPERLENDFKNKNIKALIPIANAIHQGHDIKNSDWKRLANAPDYHSVARIVNKDIAHRKPRKNALQGRLTRDGDIVAYKDGERYSVGFLDVNSDSEVVQQMIDRIIKSAGILEA